MKTLLCSLAMAGVLGFGAEASARVVVHAGPVHVGVGRVARPVNVHPRPIVSRPVVRPVGIPLPPPVVVPAPRPVVVAAPATGAGPSADARRAARALRAERIRHAIHQEVEQAVEDALEDANAGGQ